MIALSDTRKENEALVRELGRAQQINRDIVSVSSGINLNSATNHQIASAENNNQFAHMLSTTTTIPVPIKLLNEDFSGSDYHNRTMGNSALSNADHTTLSGTISLQHHRHRSSTG